LKKPKHIIKQNVLYPVGAIIFIVILVVGLFYLVELNGGKASSNWKLLIVGISTVILISHLAQRIFSWEMILKENTVEIKRPFGLMKSGKRQIQFDEIEEVGFIQGFRMNTSLKIDLKSGKKYNIFLDKNLMEISKILNFLENSDLKIGLYCDSRIKKKLKKSGLKTA